MKILALIKKENLLLTKSWQSYFLALLVPVIAVLVNIVMSKSAVTTINVGIVSNNAEVYSVIHAGLGQSKQLQFKIIKFDDLSKATDELKNGKISSIVMLSDEKNITVYHDGNRQDSQIAMQYIINSIQAFISSDLAKNYPQEVTNLFNNQKYIIQPVQNINKSEGKNSNVNTMVLFGMMWIFIFFPLNLSISQIQSEKKSGTMYYLFKIKMPKLVILFAKQTGIIVQCLLSAAILILIVKIAGIFDLRLHISQLPIAILLIMCMSSVGYFFGFILNEIGSSTLVTLILTLPTMLVTSMNTATSLDNVIRIIPSFYSGQILRSMLSGENTNFTYIIVCCAFVIVFYFLSVSIFSRREPMKLCRIS